jgi:hypothetical protein
MIFIQAMDFSTAKGGFCSQYLASIIFITDFAIRFWLIANTTRQPFTNYCSFTCFLFTSPMPAQKQAEIFIANFKNYMYETNCQCYSHAACNNGSLSLKCKKKLQGGGLCLK